MVIVPGPKVADQRDFLRLTCLRLVRKTFWPITTSEIDIPVIPPVGPAPAGI